MTPDWDHSRRRAEDVFRVVEEEVFPRLGAIDTKISSLDHAVNKLTVEGCAHRLGDLQRTERVEASTAKIFDKIDAFGVDLTAARVDLVAQVGLMKNDMTNQISGIRVWVLTGVVIVLLSVAGYFLERHFSEGGRQSAAATTVK